MYKYPVYVKRIIKLYQYYKLLLIQITNYHLNKVYYENTHYRRNLSNNNYTNWKKG